MRSIGETTTELPFADAEKLVLERGAPLLWAYLHTADGLAVGAPGTWMYDDSPGGVGYDHRREDWYRTAVDSRGPVWTTSVDENGLGLTVNCVQTIRDASGKLVAIAGVDIWLNRFIEESLESPALKQVGAESILLDASGNVLVRSTETERARASTEYTPKAYEVSDVLRLLQTMPSGHRELPGGRIAIWTTLGGAGLKYLVVGSEAAMLKAAGGP